MQFITHLLHNLYPNFSQFPTITLSSNSFAPSYSIQSTSLHSRASLRCSAIFDLYLTVVLLVFEKRHYAVTFSSVRLISLPSPLNFPPRSVKSPNVAVLQCSVFRTSTFTRVTYITYTLPLLPLVLWV